MLFSLTQHLHTWYSLISNLFNWTHMYYQMKGISGSWKVKQKYKVLLVKVLVKLMTDVSLVHAINVRLIR